MAELPINAEGAPVTDRRPVPRGVLPRGMQTWLMVGVAVGMIAIIVAAGRPNPPARPVPVLANSPAPNPDRVRDYQDRLRILETRATQETRAAAMAPTSAPVLNEEPAPTQAQDPLVAERKRRSTKACSPATSFSAAAPTASVQMPGARSCRAARAPSARDAAAPSIDGSLTQRPARLRGSRRLPRPPARFPAIPNAGSIARPAGGSPLQRPRMDPISDTGPLHRILEGTIIDAVLTNRLDGSTAAPLNAWSRTRPIRMEDSKSSFPPGLAFSARPSRYRPSAKPVWLSRFIGC